MVAAKVWRHAVATLGILVCTTALAAGQAQPAQPFKPQVGQPGKDVVWVPTSQALVDKMLDLAKVTPQDFVMDLGSGDGRTVITAAKRGARAMGIEYNPDMVDLAKKNAQSEGLGDKVSFVKADLFETDLSKASVITMFLLPSINMKLRPRILDLAPGTRVVSNTFTMEDWTPDETATLSDESCSSWCTALLWIVPAKVDGVWKIGDQELTLKQQFQNLSGSLRNGSNVVSIVNGKMHGDEISFTAGQAQYTGRVNGNTMEGKAAGGGASSWKAVRAER